MPAPNSHDFGKYKLLRRIAAGGMGEVHLAKLVGPSGFEKLVVIKRLLQSRQSEPKYVDMFFAEARVAAQLGHSNIVQVYEVGTIEQVPYIAMEYVHGKSLRKVLDRALKRPTSAGPLGMPPGFTAHIISQLCQGLAFAHDARHLSGATIGLVHRDINPHNVLISYQGEVKIIDFGIAKSELSQDQTQAGTIKGTVVYMSPEQSLGEKLDKRSDLFSVGICLYEALTGNNPFHKSGMGASLEAIRQAEYPAVDQDRKELSAFGPILGHTLARHRADRYADCAQLADALKNLLETGLVSRPPVPLATFMAELFGQEMLEEEQLLERTDMVRNPLMQSQVAHGTVPILRPTAKEGGLKEPPPPAPEGATLAQSDGFGETQADHQVSATDNKALLSDAKPRPVPSPIPLPLDGSAINTPNPLLALVRPLRPNGLRLMAWAHHLGDKPSFKKFWPYLASFLLIFSIMGTIALVTSQKTRVVAQDALTAPQGAQASLQNTWVMPTPSQLNPTGGQAPAPGPAPKILGTAEPDLLITDGSGNEGDGEGDEAAPPDAPLAERRPSRRRNRGRNHSEERARIEPAAAQNFVGPKVQIKAEPPLVVQYDNAVIDETGTRLKNITGTLRVGQNPEADHFIITLNYRLTPRGISYQIESIPWADVTGPGGILLGRTPLKWTEPSTLLSLEFTNPHSAQAQRLTLRVVR